MKKFSANVVANKMSEAVANYNGVKYHNLTVCKDIVVARVVLTPGKNDKKEAQNQQITKKGRFNNPSGVPVLCFMQNASCNKVVIYGIESGKVDIADTSVVSIRRKNLTTFSIKGARYQLKDTVNGMPRFVVRHDAHRSKMNKLQEIDF